MHRFSASTVRRLRFENATSSASRSSPCTGSNSAALASMSAASDSNSRASAWRTARCGARDTPDQREQPYQAAPARIAERAFVAVAAAAASEAIIV